MPSMQFAGRKWRVSSDDFFFPFVASFVIELFWLVLLVVFLVSHEQWAFNCTGGAQLRAFYGLAIGLTSLKLLHAGLLAWQSGRGSIRQERLRRFVPPLLWLHLGANLPASLLLYGYGCYLAFQPYECSLQTVLIARCVCLVGFGVAGLSLSAAFLMTIGPCFSFTESNGGSSSSSAAGAGGMFGRHLSPDFWSRAVSWLCCTRYDETTKAAFDNVHQILLAYFHEYDLTPSDLALGIVLLNQRDCQRQPAVACQLPEPPSPTDSDWCSLEQLQYYVKYANACYGWPLEVFNYPCLCCCHLGPHCAPCSCCRPNRTGAWGCDLAAVMHQTGLAEHQILYYDFRAEVNQAAFFLARDDDRKSFVLGVRGTLSLSDTLTDLQVAMVQVDPAQPTYQAHAGMVQCARSIAAKLAESAVLPAALAENPDYRLVLVGHSLGAGVAALLGHLLRRQHPRLACYCYSPPLQVVTPPFAEHCKEFVCCCALGEDVATHMNIANINDFQERLLCALYNCDAPKFRVFLTSAAVSGFGSRPGQPSPSPSPSSPSSQSPLVATNRTGYAALPGSRGADSTATGGVSASDVDEADVASQHQRQLLLRRAKAAFRVAVAVADADDHEAAATTAVASSNGDDTVDDIVAVAVSADHRQLDYRHQQQHNRRRSSSLSSSSPATPASLHSCFYSSQPDAVFPGHMLHLLPLSGGGGGGGGVAARYAMFRDDDSRSLDRPRLAAVWSSPEFFCQLRVTAASLVQHLPHSIASALRRVQAVEAVEAAAAS